MRNFIIVLVNLILVMKVSAQENKYVGSYNGSKHELVLQLYILPEHDFVMSMSYGAIDRLVVGKWEEQGEEIMLQEKDPGSTQPFLVYQGKAEETAGKIYTFQNFDWNTTTAFCSMDRFDPEELMYIHRPDESSFSEVNNLRVKDTSNRFFIGLEKGENLQEVYEYVSSEGYNRIYLFYNQATAYGLFQSKALLKDQTLYWIDAFGVTERVSRRDVLPTGYQQMIAEASVYNAIPDTIRREQSGSEIVYHRLLPRQVFDSEVSIDATKAYFQPDHDDRITPPKLPSKE